MTLASCDERILILAPIGRDAALAAATLEQNGITTQICADLDSLCRELARGAGGLLLTQEALSPDAHDQLLAALAAQPPWSDPPVVMLVSGETGHLSAQFAALSEQANVTFLERPIRAMTLVGAVRVGLRARRRQYELRDLLIARAEAEAAERQARALAEEAVRIRDEFLATVAHDFKNPLAVITAQAQLLHRQAVRANTPELLKLAPGLTRITTVASTATSQVDELLDLARLQANEPLHLTLAPTDLMALTRTVIAAYQQTTTSHCLELQAAVPELLGVWDERRLERVLGNLLSNAIKYSPAGGPIVVVVRSDEHAGETWAVVEVRDTGIGIPAADLPHVFERFYRARNATGQLPGTGLGLAGARQIVEQHGGTITVASIEGRGTTISVRLPVLQGS